MLAYSLEIQADTITTVTFFSAIVAIVVALILTAGRQ
jgi:hypothetical protein